jgi:orotidine-5'-phosphate decarboxylase
LKKNIFLALDFNSIEKALDATKKLKDQIAGVKIGTELYAICGTEGLKKFEEFGVEIFLDLKLHDIPNQVKKTVATIASLKSIKYLTIHTSGNLEMLKAAQESAAGSIELLGVTVLTSQSNLEGIGVKNSLKDQIKLLVNLAIKSDLSGVIASAQDISLIRSLSKELKIFCPGIRSGKDKQDQKRVMNYADFSKIADDKCFAVIGRPIIEGDPVQNIKKIIQSAE